MATVKLDDLTPQQIRDLQKQLRAKENAVTQQRNAYKNRADKAVAPIFKKLQNLSEEMSKVKTQVYNKLEHLIEEKQLAYQKEDLEQQSHSFSNLDGTQTITIGFRLNDSWDDTVHLGIQKVKDFVTKMGKDDNSKALVETILQLLSNDNKGNLKASRVLQLEKLANKIKKPEFTDAINIIKDAYKPIRTKQFISVSYKDLNGKKIDLPLSMTDVPLVTEPTE